MSDRMKAEPVGRALFMVIKHQQPAAGLIAHSVVVNKPVRITEDYWSSLAHNNPWAAKVIVGITHLWKVCLPSFKKEQVLLQRYATRAAARLDVFEYIEVFYAPNGSPHGG